MERATLYLAVVLFSVSASAACTCEVKLGAGASESATQPSTSVAAPEPARAVPQQAARDSTASPPPMAAAEPPAAEPTGKLAEASVRKTESRHHNEVRFCIEQEAAKPTSPSLRINFIVNTDGSVENKIEVVERTDVSDRLATCLVQAVKRWKFESPKGGSARASLLLSR